ncbi:hypothetical protein OCU04_004838 [Sclerotinia nivalis]|uniref:Uncharacterized protein n=1 Tax=Sclerotinia nivalis TaxID=352851 RepID=A0A9X0AS27_9HELO|nr:hypothetical protein OCU04_004838 [Sclerotinia nivalis]
MYPHPSPNNQSNPAPYSAKSTFIGLGSTYDSFSNRHPAVETVSYVVGCETVEETAKKFLEMKLIASLRGSERERKSQADLKLAIEYFYMGTVSNVCKGFEEWKILHPEINIPPVQMVFPTSGESSG